MVHPHERDRGLTGRLQERLLADHHASLGATLLEQADHAAYSAFRSWGGNRSAKSTGHPAPPCSGH